MRRQRLISMNRGLAAGKCSLRLFREVFLLIHVLQEWIALRFLWAWLSALVAGVRVLHG